MKVVINACYGGFGLSPEAVLALWAKGGPVEATPVAEYFERDRDPDSPFARKATLEKWRAYLANPEEESRRGLFLTVFSPDESLVLNARDAERSHPMLVQVVEEMGDAANGPCAKLRLVEVPEDAEWEIAEYDGSEHIAEKHRTWS